MLIFHVENLAFFTLVFYECIDYFRLFLQNSFVGFFPPKAVVFYFAHKSRQR